MTKQLSKMSYDRLQRQGIRLRPTGDADRDGTPNALDCRPLNKAEQGWIHDKYKAAKEKLKAKVETYKEERQERKEHIKEVKETRRKAYREEKVKQAAVIGTEKAKIQAKQKIEAMKKPSFLKAIVTPPKKTIAKRTARPSTRYKIIKGKAYPIASTRTRTVRKQPSRQRTGLPTMFSMEGSGGGLPPASDMLGLSGKKKSTRARDRYYGSAEHFRTEAPYRPKKGKKQTLGNLF